MSRTPTSKRSRRAMLAARTGETTMPDAIPVKRQRSVLDLDTFEDVLLIKVGSFTPVTTAAEAMERLGNSTEKFLEVVNTGLEQEFGNQMVEDKTQPWLTADEDGKPTDQVFKGSPADSGKVNALILNLAKTSFDYNKDMSVEEKRAAKDGAKDIIRSTPKILEGLKKNAAA
jgi:hypothetical protein